MINFPLPDGGIFAVIEPGNIKRLKEGMPLIVGNSYVAFTPDMAAFTALLGVPDIPDKGEPKITKPCHISTEQLVMALKAVQKNDEVIR